MRRISLATAALIATTPLFVSPQISDAATAARPMVARDFPDPAAITSLLGTYAYSTNSSYGGKWRNVPVQQGLTVFGPYHDTGVDALPKAGAWVGSPSKVWAPDVSRRSDGTYLLYYTAADKSTKRQCLGVAVSKDAKGPFTPTSTKPVVCNAKAGDTLDANSFVDADGSRWMLYKNSPSGRSTIFAHRMSADGTKLVGAATPLLRADRSDEHGIVEAPFLVRQNNKYFLFYSGQFFNSGSYFENYATATSLTGKYVKAPGQWISQQTTGGRLRNPGGAAVVRGSFNTQLVLHADLPAKARAYTPRAMFSGTILWLGGKPSFILHQPLL